MLGPRIGEDMRIIIIIIKKQGQMNLVVISKLIGTHQRVKPEVTSRNCNAGLVRRERYENKPD